MTRLSWLTMMALLACTACSKHENAQKGSAKNDSTIEADFRALDANHDGGISKEEAQKGGTDVLVANFGTYDANNDGKLSLQEITAYVIAQRAENARRKSTTFAMLDTDKDSGISREEAEKAKMLFMTTNFESIDTNKDGKLSQQELDIFSEHISDQPVPAQKPGAPGPLFIKADKDGNGTLSREEAKDTPDLYKNFDAMDTDHNGGLTPLEIVTFMNAHANSAQEPQAKSIQ